MSSSRRTAKKPATKRPAPAPVAGKASKAKGKPVVSEFMSKAPHSIGRDQTLDAAHEIMRRHLIRHLPVLEGGNLVGIVSQRDLYLIETLRDVDPAATLVEEAMSPEAYCVSSDTPLQEVVGTMTRRKIGCTIVTRGRDVVGLFTTTDAMRALDRLLRGS